MPSQLEEAIAELEAVIKATATKNKEHAAQRICEATRVAHLFIVVSANTGDKSWNPKVAKHTDALFQQATEKTAGTPFEPNVATRARLVAAYTRFKNFKSKPGKSAMANLLRHGRRLT